jgi:predicted NodU family carbamoyl transferase
LRGGVFPSVGQRFELKLTPMRTILHEFGDEYFEDYQESPYMEKTLKFKQAVLHKVPAVFHVNKTGRLQTVYG